MAAKGANAHESALEDDSVYFFPRNSHSARRLGLEGLASQIPKHSHFRRATRPFVGTPSFRCRLPRVGPCKVSALVWNRSFTDGENFIFRTDGVVREQLSPNCSATGSSSFEKCPDLNARLGGHPSSPSLATPGGASCPLRTRGKAAAWLNLV